MASDERLRRMQIQCAKFSEGPKMSEDIAAWKEDQKERNIDTCEDVESINKNCNYDVRNKKMINQHTHSHQQILQTIFEILFGLNSKN